MKRSKVFHNAKVVAGFALLGAVAVGMLANGLTDFDLRPYGAAIGAGGAIAVKLYHLL